MHPETQYTLTVRKNHCQGLHRSYRNAFFFQPIQRTLFFQQKRFRTRINIQKPKPYFYYKRQVMKFVLPFYKHPYEGLEYKDVCENVVTKQEVEDTKYNPYEALIAKELLQRFLNAKMIAFLHVNSITRRREFDLRVLCHKQNMEFFVSGHQLVRVAVKDTIFEPIKCLLNPNMALVFAKEVKADVLHKILRKFPQYALMAGVIENRFLDRNEFLRYGSMDLTSARVGLVQLLQSAGGNNLNRQLTHHQTTLISHLKQIGTNESSSETTE